VRLTLMRVTTMCLSKFMVEPAVNYYFRPRTANGRYANTFGFASLPSFAFLREMGIEA